MGSSSPLLNLEVSCAVFQGIYMIRKYVEHFNLILVSHVLIFICYQANNETGFGGKVLLSLLGRNSYSEFRAPESEANFATSIGECCSGNDVTVWRHERYLPNLLQVSETIMRSHLAS